MKKVSAVLVFNGEKLDPVIEAETPLIVDASKGLILKNRFGRVSKKVRKRLKAEAKRK